MVAEQTVKACGKRHPWCRECRPQQAAAMRKPPAPRKTYERECRDCGRCNACLGIEAPDGLHWCRICERFKPLAKFSPRSDTKRGRRNDCNDCRNNKQQGLKCERCGKTFQSYRSKHRVCAKCRAGSERPCDICGTPFKVNTGRYRYCSADCTAEAGRRARQQQHRALRIAAFKAYGGEHPACACCGEDNIGFLALDHIDGGGHRQRQETGGGGFWTWLKRNNYPPGFQVLCHNCNMGRQLNGGTCPHQS